MRILRLRSLQLGNERQIDSLTVIANLEINKVVLSMKSVLTVKTDFVSQLWHSFCERGCPSKGLST